MGRHLAAHLVSLGHEVSGLTRGDPAGTPPGVRPLRGDLCDPAAVDSALGLAGPECVYHLAGLNKAPDPRALYRANVLGTVTLLEALERSRSEARVVVASSSAVYGQLSADRPIVETDPTQPITTYGASKLAQEVAARRYHASGAVPVVVTRTFNLLGPDLPPLYAGSALASQIAAAELSSPPPRIAVGRLDSQRDFTDVRDAVRAYALLGERGRDGETYNVCSGEPVSISRCAEQLLSMAKVPLSVQVRAERVQANDVTVQRGSAEKLRRETGWEPAVPLEQSLADLLNFWRGEVAKHGLER